MINIQHGMSPQLYMSMHGLNNLINNNVQLERLDNINNIDNINNNVRHQRQRQLQYHNLIDIHQVNSTYTVHIIVHQHINIHVIIHHLIATS